MIEQLNTLYELQRIDTEIQQKTQYLAEMDTGARAKKKLTAAEAELTDARERLKSLESRQRARELELESADAERKAKRDRAYGGTVADTKELAALEKKIEELHRRGSQLEDEILELLDKVEATRAEVAEKEKQVEAACAVFEKTRKHYRAAKEKIEADTAELRSRRQETLAQLEPALAEEYAALQEKLEGIAVSGIEGNLCEVCRTVIPSSRIGLVKAARDLVRCENCRRILYPSNPW